jgi:hypothetical protein
MQTIKKIGLVTATALLLFSSCARKSSYGCPFSAKQIPKEIKVKKSV